MNKNVYSKDGIFDEVWRYKDLLYLLAKKQLSIRYNQTILGLLWFFLTPLLTAIVYALIFGNFISIDNGNIPHILFYLSGIILWEFFQSTINRISNVFHENAGTMSKVYYPRIIPALATIGANTVNFCIQFMVFILFYVYFWYVGEISPSIEILFTPLYFINLALLAFGIGVFIASYTAKYRDIFPVINFIMKILMFISPILYPIKIIPEKFRTFVELNPLIGIFENFRSGWFGYEDINYWYIFYPIIVTSILLYFGIRSYNKTALTFIDTI